MLIQAGQQRLRQRGGLIGLFRRGSCRHVVQTIGDQGAQHIGRVLQPLGEGLAAAVAAPLGIGGQHQPLDVVLHVHVHAVLQALVVLVACASAAAAAGSAAAASAAASAGKGGHDLCIGRAQCKAAGIGEVRGRAGAHQIQRQALERIAAVLGRGGDGHLGAAGPIDRVVRIAGAAIAALDGHRAACAALGLGAVVAGGRSLADGDRIVVCTLRPVVSVCTSAAVHAPSYLAAGEVGQRGVLACTGHCRSTAGKVVAVGHFDIRQVRSKAKVFSCNITEGISDFTTTVC